MIRLIIARHGNTVQPFEQPRRIGRVEDPALTTTGQAQAERLGRCLAGKLWDIVSVHTAPLRRTVQTASIVAQALHPSPLFIVDPWLSEIDHGPDEGRPEEEVIARLGGRALEDWDRLGLPPPGWKVSPSSLEQAWRDAAASLSTGTHLLVTSNGIARFAVKALIQDGWPASLKLATGAFGVVTLGSRGNRLNCWNELPPEVVNG